MNAPKIMQMLHLGFASGVHHNAVPPLRAPYETCPSYTTSCFLISACSHPHQKTTSSLALHGYLSTTADSAHAVQRNLKKETTLHAQPSVCSDVHTQKHRAQEVSHLLKKKTDHVSLACAGVAQTLLENVVVRLPWQIPNPLRSSQASFEPELLSFPLKPSCATERWFPLWKTTPRNSRTTRL